MKKNVRETVHSKFSWKCAYCWDDIQYQDMQVDHIIPKRNFKSCILNQYKIPSFLSHLTIDDVDHIDNYFPACRVCNKRKDTFYLEDFRTEIQKQTERMKRNVSSYRFALKYKMIEETWIDIVFYFEK